MALIYLYRGTLGWLLGGQCRFHPTCSQYGLDAIRIHGPFYGAWVDAQAASHAVNSAKGGYDPVPFSDMTHRTEPGSKP